MRVLAGDERLRRNGRREYEREKERERGIEEANGFARPLPPIEKGSAPAGDLGSEEECKSRPVTNILMCS